MKITLKKALMTAALVVPSLAMNIAAAQSYNMTVAGASPGGLWSLLGAGLDSAMKAEFPGSTVTYQTSGGGLANVAVLQRDVFDVGGLAAHGNAELLDQLVGHAVGLAAAPDDGG